MELSRRRSAGTRGRGGVIRRRARSDACSAESLSDRPGAQQLVRSLEENGLATETFAGAMRPTRECERAPAHRAPQVAAGRERPRQSEPQSSSAGSFLAEVDLVSTATKRMNETTDKHRLKRSSPAATKTMVRCALWSAPACCRL